VEASHTVEIVRAPAFGNENLRAQRGLFTIVRPRDTRARVAEGTTNSQAPGSPPPPVSPLGGDPASRDENPPLEQVVAPFEDEAAGCGVGPLLRKYTLPHSHAPELLRLLDAHEISAATLFPGYGGVVRSLCQRRLWEETEGTAACDLTVPLTEDTGRQLCEAAERLRVPVEGLAAAAVRDWLTRPSDDFDAMARRVLGENTDP
jgi:hypothetical protein